MDFNSNPENTAQIQPLYVQTYLKEKTLETLKLELGIKSKLDATSRLVILNYDQVDSHKVRNNQIVSECRQLVLEVGTWNVVAKSFHRFWNWNEDKESDKIFLDNPSDKIIYEEKHDGSIIMIFCYENEWFLVSRSSFTGRLSTDKDIWLKYFEKTAGISLKEIGQRLDPFRSYIFEICGEENLVVRHYLKPTIYLLASFHKQTLKELNNVELDLVAENIPCEILRPEIHSIASLSNTKDYLDLISEKEAAFEGVVAKVAIGDFFHRLKFKTPTYLIMHHFGDNYIKAKLIVPLVLSGEVSEIKSHPRFKKHCDLIDKVEAAMALDLDLNLKLWAEVKCITSQKEFSEKIKAVPYRSIFFNARKHNRSFQDQWKLSADSITAVLKTNHNL